MGAKKHTLIAGPEHEGVRLDQALADWLPKALGREVSKAKVRKLVLAGAVYLNGARVRIASKPLRPRARIEAFVDLEKLFDDAASREKAGASLPQGFKLSAADVLYEDEWLIAVNKPAGLPTQPTLDDARANLYALLIRFLSERDGVAEAYVGLHHRLDRDTSGVVLFTKKKEANAGVGELFQKHLAQKTYQAVSEIRERAPAEAEWRVKNFLARDPGKKGRMRAVRAGGDVAITDFRLLGVAGKFAWIEAKPLTGRMHQIRVHLAEQGWPILFDVAYGARSGSGRVMLHAARLEFPHPITKTPISVAAPVPRDFSECLTAHGF